jgi:hypothetical protein
VTVDEFIEIWRTHKSPGKVAKVLGIAERNVMARRRRIEALRGIDLSSDVSIPIIQDHPKRLDLGILNGKIVVFSDAHFWPGVRTTAFKALLRFIKTYKPRAVICNGDAFDGASISRFPRIGWDSTPSVKDELLACTTALGEVEEASADAKLIWPLGNHDARFENRLAANSPQYEHVKGFSLQDHFPKWHPCWAVWNCDTVIKHRILNGVAATRGNVLKSGCSTVTGHLHSLRVWPHSDYGSHTKYGVDCGTLAEPTGPQFRNYLEDGPTDWRSGFVCLTFKDGIMLWPEVISVFAKDVVEFRGELHDVSSF